MKNIQLDFDEVRAAIEASSKDSIIYLGADSQRFPLRLPSGKRVTMIAFVVAIVIHYNGKHGGKLFKEVYFEEDYSGSLRDRLMREVGHVARAGQEIIDSIGERTLEIHLDINPNPNHQSNVVMKEATGWIFGQFGIRPKVKPESFASSTIADRYAVRGARTHARKKGKRVTTLRR